MTNKEFKEWLSKHDSIRCILVELSVMTAGGLVTRYLSTKGFVTGTGDVPENVAYLPIITGEFTVTEELSLDGSATIGYGDIEINNDAGQYDSWLNEGWNNQPINVYLGDVRWLRSDFKRIYSGAISRIDSRTRSRLNIKLNDKLQFLNKPLTETKVGGTGENRDVLKPSCYGEVHNVKPVMIDSVLLKYAVHTGAIERIIEVRDDGNPVPFLQDISTGTFTLYTKPRGVITASVQGDKAGGIYTNNPGEIIKRIVKANGFTDADLDLVSWNEFMQLYQQPVGVYLTDRINTLEVCAKVAASINATLAMNSDSKAFLFKMKMPTSSTNELTGQVMTSDSFEVLERPDIQAAVKIGYCLNWTVQENLLTGIPEQHKLYFAKEWLTVTKVNTVSAAANKLPVEPVQKDTYLLTEVDATNLADELVNLWSTQRTVFGYGGAPSLITEQLGSSQLIWHNRFDFSNSKLGLVVGIQRKYLEGRAVIKVLV